MINWTYVVVAFSAGGLVGMLLMSWLAMSGRQIRNGMRSR